MQAEYYRETMPKEWQEGYRAAMNDAACVARELYVNHTYHTGADGLLARCQEAEQVFIGDAEKMLSLLRHNT